MKCTVHHHVCHGQKSRFFGDGRPPTFNRNPYNGYINPHYWVDDQPLLCGHNGSLDPGTWNLGVSNLWFSGVAMIFWISPGLVSCASKVRFNMRKKVVPLLVQNGKKHVLILHLPTLCLILKRKIYIYIPGPCKGCQMNGKGCHSLRFEHHPLEGAGMYTYIYI